MLHKHVCLHLHHMPKANTDTRYMHINSFAGGSQLLLWAVRLLLITRLKRTVANAFFLAGSRLVEDTLPVFG